MARRAAWLTMIAMVGCATARDGADADGIELAPRASDGGETTEAALAALAVDDDPRRAEGAIEELRRRGRHGHAALMREHAEAIASLRAEGRTTPARERLRHAIDRVSGQRDGHASGLYWHTDLAAAREEAGETGRPILSLRLLGRLDEELSCANSRYFRILLYSSPSLSRALREEWVLHWQSERPAPVITIDMGDGRRIERTITGNSVHHVLDREGRPLDALVRERDEVAREGSFKTPRKLSRLDDRRVGGHLSFSL